MWAREEREKGECVCVSERASVKEYTLQGRENTQGEGTALFRKEEAPFSLRRQIRKEEGTRLDNALRERYQGALSRREALKNRGP